MLSTVSWWTRSLHDFFNYGTYHNALGRDWQAEWREEHPPSHPHRRGRPITESQLQGAAGVFLSIDIECKEPQLPHDEGPRGEAVRAAEDST